MFKWQAYQRRRDLVSQTTHQPYNLEFEVGNWDKVFELWQNLVKQKGVGYRYFEYDDPKYVKFYKSRK